MEDKPSAERDKPASELGAAEAISSRAFEEGPSDKSTSKTNEGTGGTGEMICPKCGRTVEAGFRFCDGCGTPLVAATPDATQEAPKSSETQGELQFPPPIVEAPLVRPPEAGGKSRATEAPEKVSLLERWRRRRAERSELGEAERALGVSPAHLGDTDVVEEPMPPRRATGAVPRPMTAEELRGAKPVISGRLRWSDTESGTASAEATPSAPMAEEIQTETIERWQPVTAPEPAARWGASEILRFLLHLVIAFFCGAVLLGVIAAVGTFASDGSVAILEMRGLPIFIGGAVSIVVFALLRTSGPRRLAAETRRSSAVLSIVAGLAVLVVAAALLYQPSVAARMQPRIERALGVYSEADEEAASGFQQDILEWNEDSDQYEALLQSSVRDGLEFDRFRARADEAETSLADLVAQMRSHAEAAEHAELRDGLDDLASVYDDQLGGLRLVNRGLLIDGIELIRTGNARFKDAKERGETLFSRRLRPLLERAGVDADAFGEALAG